VRVPRFGESVSESSVWYPLRSFSSKRYRWSIIRQFCEAIGTNEAFGRSAEKITSNKTRGLFLGKSVYLHRFLCLEISWVLEWKRDAFVGEPVRFILYFDPSPFETCIKDYSVFINRCMLLRTKIVSLGKGLTFFIVFYMLHNILLFW